MARIKIMLQFAVLSFVLGIGWSHQAEAQSQPVINGTDTVYYNIQPDAEEAAILRELYEETNGDQWTNKTNWLTGTTSQDLANWFGVVIEYGDVAEIHLDNNNLSGTIPKNVNRLARLRRITYSGNSLSASINGRIAADNAVVPLAAPIPTSPEISRGKNLPIWGLSMASSPIQQVDWRTTSPTIRVLENSAVATAAGASGVAIDACGRLAFYALHTGVQTSNFQLHLYASDGTRLTNDIPTSPHRGLNSVYGNVELQIVPVPGIVNEWYVIYSLVPEAGAPCITNQGKVYCPAKVGYTRLLYDRDANVFRIDERERDRLLTDSFTVIHGKAVSQLMHDDLSVGPYHYLYLGRRGLNETSMSVYRFKIHAQGIDHGEASQRPFTLDYWGLTMAGSSIALTQDGKTLAISNRNQPSTSGTTVNTITDFIVFDLSQFYNKDYVPLLINVQQDLNVVAEGITDRPTVETLQSRGYTCLKYMDSKLSLLEFSPSGRFLYAVNGGYVSDDNLRSYSTYLLQIDLQSNPGSDNKDVRMQVQQAVNLNFGCEGTISSNTLKHHISSIESGYDGRLYFIKMNLPTLFVIPHPDDFMPSSLTPYEVNLEEPGAPNINMANNAQPVYMPENIDGFNYIAYTEGTPNFTLTNSIVGTTTPAQVSIADYSPNRQYEIWWGDGTIQAVSAAKTTHTYTAVGRYVVSLLVTDETGCTVKTSRELNVILCNEVIDIDFQNANYACAVKFSTRKLGNCLTTYAWDFGDGTTSNERNPIHAYAAPATYNVTLKVDWNCSGCSGSKTLSKQITYTETAPSVEQVTIDVPTDKRPEVISTTVATYSEAWPLRHTSDAIDAKSSYENGSQGLWRNEAAFEYHKERQLSAKTNLAKDGTFTLDQFNWEFADLEAIPGWTTDEKITQYSPYGYEAERKDVFDTYSSILYDYEGGRLPAAQGVNMRQDEMAFTSFEYMDGAVTGNWIMKNAGTPAYTSYRILIARGNRAIVVARPEDLEDVVAVDVTTNKSFWFGLRNVLPYTRNQIICKEPYPGNPALSVVVFKTTPYAGLWSGTMRIKNIVFPPATAVLDNTIAHTGKKSMLINTQKTFRQELLHPDAGKAYYVNTWVSVNNPSVMTPQLPAGLGIDIVAYRKNGQQISEFRFTPAGPVIEGWQQIKGTFVCPGETAFIAVRFNPASSGNAWYDDLRFQTEKGNMTASVYNLDDYRLQATLDVENFATWYYYDREGAQRLIKTETRQGVKTLGEKISYQAKHPYEVQH